MKKTKKQDYDPYTEVINNFNKKGVKYVVVGMSGINYYADTAAQIFATQDYDIFIDNKINNLRKVIDILKKMKFCISTSEGMLDEKKIKHILIDKKTLMAANEQGVCIEIITAVSGYSFKELEADVVIFNIDDVPVKVGSLRKLLDSKKQANREKDRLFLKRYELSFKKA